MSVRSHAFACLLVCFTAGAWSVQATASEPATTIAKATLSSSAAQKALTAAVAEAERNGWAMSIAVVDAAGDLLAFQRMDKAPVATGDVAQAKARTAARFGMPTKAIGEMVNRIGVNMLTTPDMISLGGGLTIIVDGQLVGAIGMSGGNGEQDEQVGRAGLASIGVSK